MMKLLEVKSLIIFVILAFTSGCALFPAASDKTANTLGKTIVYYCENIAPYTLPAERQAFIAKINERATPHSTEPLNCAGIDF